MPRNNYMQQNASFFVTIRQTKCIFSSCLLHVSTIRVVIASSQFGLQTDTNVQKIQVYLLKPLANPVGRFEPRCEKTGLRCFRPGPTQTGLNSHRK